MNPPGPLDPTRTTTLDGNLYAEIFLPKSAPQGVVLVTHGYAEHCGRYHEVAHVIVAAGWAVLTYDVRGHGHSPGARGAIDRFDTYLSDLNVAHRAATELAPGKPLVLLGHSAGSLITLRALCSDAPPEAVAVIVSSPFLALRLAVPSWRKVLARVASRIAPNLAQSNQLRAEDLTHDAKKQAERVADKLCFDLVTPRWFTEAAAAQDFVAANAGRIKVPTTWLVGGDDPIADPSQSKRVAASVAGAQYHDLTGFLHEVFNEVDRGKPFAEVQKTLSAIAHRA